MANDSLQVSGSWIFRADAFWVHYDGRLLGICVSDEVSYGPLEPSYMVLPVDRIQTSLQRMGLAHLPLSLASLGLTPPEAPFTYAVEAEDFTGVTLRSAKTVPAASVLRNWLIRVCKPLLVGRRRNFSEVINGKDKKSGRLLLLRNRTICLKMEQLVS